MQVTHVLRENWADGHSGGGAMAPRRLLIVGDPALSRGLMRMVLSRLGYVVTCVDYGPARRWWPWRTRSFALALLALQLPDLPGLTLARRLRGTPGPVGAMPIILFGDAWDPERILESCREARLDGYLPKPISIGRLVSSVRDLIQRLPQRDRSRHAHARPAPIALEQLDARSPTATPSSSASWARSTLRPPRSTSTRCARPWRPGGDWSQPAHALKGASANIGATELARLTAEAEHARPSPRRLAEIEQALDAVRGFFRHRAESTPPHRDMWRACSWLAATVCAGLSVLPQGA